MFRSSDSTFGLGANKEDELNWSPSADDTKGTGDMPKTDFRFPLPETYPGKDLLQNDDPTETYYVDDPAMTCGPTFLKDSSWPADKYESSLAKRHVTTTNSCLDDISLESASLLQLQLVMEQSPERRHNHVNLDDACGDEKEASGAFVTDRINEHTGSMDMETDTNPIGRSTTHLLFHRPADTYSVPANDSLPFRSPRMAHGSVTTLDGVQWMQEIPNGMYRYFVKVVPTIYTSFRGHKIQSNQFSVTENSKSSAVDNLRSLPGVVFFYDLSPIKVTFTEEHIPFLHFLTHICHIVGGIFTVAAIVNSFVYHGQKALGKKQEIGKLG